MGSSQIFNIKALWNPYSMFLTAIDEKEVIEIVKQSKHQKSLDCNDIDMIVV